MQTNNPDENNHQGVIHLVALRPLLASPVAPSAVTAEQAGDAVRVRWPSVSENESGFVVERRAAGGSWQTVGLLYRNATTFVDRSAKQGTAYEYRVRAFNPVGESSHALSPPVTPTTQSREEYGAITISPTPNGGEGTRFMVLGDGFLPTHAKAGALRMDTGGTTRIVRGAGTARRYDLALLVRNVESAREHGSRLDLEGLLGLRTTLWLAEPGNMAPIPVVVVDGWSIELIGGTEEEGEYWLARVEVEAQS
jgi:hypothetical protein